jgi:RND superfamily putative drug exporter
VVLATLFVPALGLGDRVDLPSAGAMPADSQVRQATEIGAKAYGPGVLSPVEVVVRGTPETVKDDARRVGQVLATDPEVRNVRLVPLEEDDLYRVSAATAHGPASDGAEGLVKNLREGPLHESLAGVRYDVGGESAMRLDANHALFEYLPLMLAVLLALVLVLFMVAMRSVVLPVKGVLMVVVSLGASAGGLLLLSTTELGARLIGWSQPQDLHPIVPVTIVAIVVALSTDYEVILISRIAEVYRETADNTRAIVTGVAQTGRVISSAAAIMVAVFFGFALSDVTPLRQLGVGLAFAVLVDATVVRGVLVPASMQLMGRWNWWFPRVGLRSGDVRVTEQERCWSPCESHALPSAGRSR